MRVGATRSVFGYTPNSRRIFFLLSSLLGLSTLLLLACGCRHDLATGRVVDIIAQPLLGQKNTLATVYHKVSTQFIVVLALFVRLFGSQGREVAELGTQHEGEASQENLFKFSRLHLGSNLVLYINVSNTVQRIGLVLHATRVRHHRGLQLVQRGAVS